MAGTKIAKKLPKRAASSHLKDARKRRYATGKERKVARVAKNEAQAKVNETADPSMFDPRLLPSSRRNRVRPRRDRDGNFTNMKMCNRCERRRIVAGSVCWCRTIGESAR